ncbi:restriction endonuclease subunit S [Rickettsia gravesii]|uniref:restriction endonuclease subunit S n=1 Tax=Rickettsia gravesii TaxID=354585 RepID=UPI00191C07FD
MPFIQTGDIPKSSSYVRYYKQTLNEKGLKVSRLFPKGTIVLAIAANIGITAILDFDSVFPDSIVGITPKNNVYHAVFEMPVESYVKVVYVYVILYYSLMAYLL